MRILLMEDKASVASFIRRGLREERYVVDLVGDGAQAEARARECDYDAIVLDLMLPLRGGLEVCRNLRAAGVLTPILMLTARDGLDDKVAGLHAGGDDYLTEPFPFEELLARLRALLRCGCRTPPGALRIAGLALEPLTHKVTRAGQAIVLTTEGYQLLEYLIQHAGQVVSRTRLSEHVCSCQEDTFTNVADVYIAPLCKKIDRGFRPALVHTGRGVGYMLREEQQSVGRALSAAS